MDFDLVLEHLGEFGKYQKILYALMFLSTMHLGSNMMSFVFNSVVPEFRCFVDECDSNESIYNAEWFINFNQTDLDVQCSYLSDFNADCLASFRNFSDDFKCGKWIYDQTTFQSTVVSEWDLVCDRSWLNTLAVSTWMVGLTVGSILFGQFSDIYGRRFSLTNAAVLNVIICFTIPFSINYPMFLVMRFLQAVVDVGFYDIATILALEFVGQSKRVFCGIGMSIGFCLGSVALGGMSYLIPNWRYLHFYLALPSLFFLLFIWVLPESVRWLILHKKHDEAIDVISRMAVTNGVSVPDKILKYTKEDKTDESNKVSSSITQFFTNRVLRRKTMSLFAMWGLIVFGFYGISMNTVNLGGNIFLNFILASLIELPALIFCLFILDRSGRRIPMSVLLVIGGFFCLATAFIPKADYKYYLTIAFVLVAKFGLVASYGAIVVFTAEIVPTCLRNSGLGMCSFFANLGAVIAPYVSSLSDYDPQLPLLVFGIAIVIAGGLVFTLPETLGKVLPETIDDANEFDKTKKKTISLPDVHVISMRG